MKGKCKLLTFLSGGSRAECTAYQCSQCPKKNNVGVITPKCWKVERYEQTED